MKRRERWAQKGDKDFHSATPCLLITLSFNMHFSLLQCTPSSLLWMSYFTPAKSKRKPVEQLCYLIISITDCLQKVSAFVSPSLTSVLVYLKAAIGPGIAWWWEMASKPANTQQPSSRHYYTERREGSRDKTRPLHRLIMYVCVCVCPSRTQIQACICVRDLF